MKYAVLFLLAVMLAVGCGTPREQSNAKIKSAMLTYGELSELQQQLLNADPAKKTQIEARIDELTTAVNKLMDEATKLDPENLDAFYNYGILLRAQQYPNEAIPRQLTAYNILVKQQGKPPYTAISDMKMRDSIQNTWNTINNELYLCYKAMKKLDSALIFAENIRDYFPSRYAEATLLAGFDAQSKGKFEEAIKTFETALQAYKKAIERNASPDALQGIGTAAYYIQEGYKAKAKATKGKPDYEKIYNAYEFAIAAAPTEVENYLKLADIANEGSDKKRVEETYKKAREKFPKNTTVLTNYGLWLVDNNRAKEAIEPLRAVVDANPRVPVNYFNLGSAYSKAGNKAEMINNLKKFVELGEKDPSQKSNVEAIKKELAGMGVKM